jgi:hypothetical protein
MDDIRDCPSYPGYAASDDGRIFSHWVRATGGRRNAMVSVPTMLQPLKQVRRKKYLVVTISQRRRPVAVHLLVLDAFVGPRPPGLETRHLDGDEKNNRRINLAYGTPAENGADKRRLGEAASGERNGRARLTEAQVRWIREKAAGGMSLAAIGRAFALGRSTIHAVVSGKTWRTT